jgi:excisionase family DNA binding protein
MDRDREPRPLRDRGVEAIVEPDSSHRAGERVPARRSIAGSTLTVDEAREIFGVGRISRDALYNAIKKNEVPHVKLGRRVLIPRDCRGDKGQGCWSRDDACPICRSAWSSESAHFGSSYFGNSSA